ncbi:AHH domain-containing protein [Rhodanobacter sp. FDAARGOS 1247]|uniref:AHH domain-containing protein n=1 Tax=Rhodanobacter sp. FDAARGOS 1247 TaxID=2778082 RepID=UPI0019515D9D|nr:AHH domain-containing protein [Rhodanobacter sp. FDAARGOS 1247]QRP65200.1 AHH domain-containing protein [Rhodanobacter sp. FDAARGOS 1247]
MTKKPSDLPATGALAPMTQDRLLDLTLAANLIVDPKSGANPYEMRNRLLTRKEKARVRYLNGMTLPTSAEVLSANAEDRGYNHRRTLSRNIVHGTKQPRQVDVCAHHIVAWRDSAADLSRIRLFGCGIGINDADNGVFLPRFANKLPDYPNAPRHDPHHHPEYHFAVYDKLRDVEPGDTHQCRATLKSLRADILSGLLPL